MSCTYAHSPAGFSFRVFSFSLIAIILAGLPATSRADTEMQSDWSGGPGAQVPVFEWSDTFLSTSQTSWRSVPGQLAISSVPNQGPGGPIVQPSRSCLAVASGDLDGDGDLDLTAPLGGEVRWYENAGDGVNWTEHVVDDDFYGGQGITARDIDGDGDLDIVASAFYGDPSENGRYVWYENVHGDASVWVKDPIAGYLWGTEMAEVVDMDGDGDLDVYGCSSLTSVGNFNDDIYWFDNENGDGSEWTQRKIDDDYDAAIDAAAADIDGDGDPDVVCTSYGSMDINWWENTGGDGVDWVKHLVFDHTTTDGSVAVGDLDDDGDVDVVATGWSAGSVARFENLDGHGGSWAGYAVGPISHGTDVEIADLDGDGRLDVLAASISAIYWYRNLGNGSFTLYLATYPERTGEAAIASDINGDGALEVVYTVEGYYNGDVAGLFRRSITSFRDQGALESEVLDAGGARTWTAIGWDATVPKGAALALQVRSSSDPDDLGPWSADITSPGSLLGILAPGTRYVQYKVILSSADPQVSPIVREVSLEAEDPASAPDVDPGSGVPSDRYPVVALQAPWPNPSPGAATTRFTLRTEGFTRMDILDAQGRRISTPLVEVLAAGTYDVDLPELRPGVYLVRLDWRGAAVARKLVVR